jgi:molecular chaperone DnaJ
MLMDSKRDYYEILGVRRDASFEEIKRAYRRKALEYHPDQNPGDRAAEMLFKEVLTAYKILADPSKRREYDQHGAPRRPGPGASFHTTDEDQFHQSFVRESARGGSTRTGRRQPAPGTDLRTILEIELEEAARGTCRTVEIMREDLCDECRGTGARAGTRVEVCRHCGGRREVVQRRGYYREVVACAVCKGKGTTIDDPCSRCQGSGKIRGLAHVAVSLAPGIEDGESVVIPNQGEAGEPGAARGNLCVRVHFRPHPFFVRKGKDLSCQVPISFPQAVLGAEIEVPTLNGLERLTVPQGTQTGEVLRLRGRGLPGRNGMTAGDELVEVVVETPCHLPPHDQELLRELSTAIEHGNVSPKRKSYLERLRARYPEAQPAFEVSLP